MTNITAVGPIDSSGRRAIESLIEQGVCNSAVYHAEAGSTNTLAISDLQNGELDTSLGDLPRLYLADQQTSGRGRHGRSWQSDGGTLTFSLLVPFQPESEDVGRLLSIAVGVAIARSIEYSFAPLQTRLKWPNDVYIDSGKVAGILMETSPAQPQQVVIGVGINVGTTPEIDDHTSAAPARSLAQVTGTLTKRYDLLPIVIEQITESITELEGDPSEILTDFRKRCLLTGQTIQFQSPSGTQQGHCQGITDTGHLKINTETGPQQIESGEATTLRLTP